MDNLETSEGQPVSSESPRETPAQPPLDFEALMERQAQLERQQRQNPANLDPEVIRGFMAELHTYAETATQEEKDTLEAAHRRWTAFLELQEAMTSNRRGGIPVWALMLITVAGVLSASLGVTWLLRPDTTPTVAPTQISMADQTPEIQPTTVETAILPPPTVEVLATPTAAFQVLPTVTPAPTTEAPPTPTPESTPTPLPSVPPHTDPNGDVTALAGGQAVTDPPPGLDAISCNIGADTIVLVDALPPFTVPSAGNEERLTFWLQLAEAAPAQRTLTYHWLLALDVDGNSGTGRPMGAGYINPDLGTEVGAGIFLYPEGRTEPYLYIWDSAAGDWASGTRVPGILEVTFTETRDAIAFSLPIKELSAAIQSISAVTLNETALRGRLGTIASSDTVAAEVDFCPNLP